MKFSPSSNWPLDCLIEGLSFLRKAYEEDRVTEIENMDDVIDSIDIVGYVEHLESILNFYSIPF